MFIMWYFFMLKYRKRQMWECPTSAFGLFVAIMTLARIYISTPCTVDYSLASFSNSSIDFEITFPSLAC